MADSNRVLTGVDVDPDVVADELDRLADAIRESNALMQGVDTAESVRVEESATESITVEYVLTERFDGLHPLRYDTGGSE